MPLDLDHLLALALRLLAQAQVLGALAPLLAALLEGVDAFAERFGQAQPGEAQRQRHAGHQRGDPQHARAGEAEPLHRQRAQRVAEHAAGMAGQERLEAVQARPLERRAGGQQQRQAEPERAPALRASVRRLAAQAARQCRQPGPRGHQRQPPDRVAEQEQREVGHPGADLAGLVAQRLAGARGGEGGVGSVVGDQRQQRQQPEHGAGQQPELRGAAARRQRRAASAASAGGRRLRAAVGAQRSEGKSHAGIVAQQGGASRPARLQSLLQALLDDHRAVFLGLDHAALFQVLHDAADHLARGADHLGHVLARHLVADDLHAVHVFGHVEQGAGHAAVDVEQRQRLDLPVGSAQARHQAAHDGVGQLGVVGQAARELGRPSTSMSVCTSARTVAECGSLSIRLISPT